MWPCYDPNKINKIMLSKKSNSIRNQKSSDKINREKFCISAIGPNLDALVDSRFGRAMFFLIVDNKGNLIKSIKNKGAQVMRGAGVASAQLVANEKANIVISGNIGPNAFEVLHTSGIKIFLAKPKITVKDISKEYWKGNLTEIDRKSVSRLSFGHGFGQRRIL